MSRWLVVCIVTWMSLPSAVLAQAQDAEASTDPPTTKIEVIAPDSALIKQDLRDHRWGEVVRDVWEVELFKAGNTGVHLNQLIIALLLCLVGVWLARRVSNLMHRRLRHMRHVDPNVAAALQKLSFYGLSTVVVLIALPIAGVPITIFTVLGGAIAIGIGFGAQNLFNNLISGLIIMSERPIRLGDIVEVGDHHGRIEEIGNRCTRVRRFDGIDVLVPNSSFLQEPVVNWTLKDTDLRGSVSVGVAYGSPVSTVRDLILKAAKDHGKIHPSPNPEVLFTEFGDNTLNFVVYFWCTVTRPLDLRRIESDLRYKIDHLFHDAGITIAFPQRDVHLDTLRPLEVRLSAANPGDTSPLEPLP